VERSGQMFCYNVELKAIQTMEQPTLNQRNIKSTKILTTIEKLPLIKGNELHKPFIFFLSFFSFFKISFIFVFPFFFQMKIKTSKG